MRLIIAGSRSICPPMFSWLIVRYAVRMSGIDRKQIKAVISGCADGPDQFAIRFAERYGIEVVRMPANWDRDGRSAGYKRNLAMAKEGDVLIAIWDGKSGGTGHMIRTMLSLGKRVFTMKVTM